MGSVAPHLLHHHLRWSSILQFTHHHHHEVVSGKFIITITTIIIITIQETTVSSNRMEVEAQHLHWAPPPQTTKHTQVEAVFAVEAAITLVEVTVLVATTAKSSPWWIVAIVAAVLVVGSALLSQEVVAEALGFCHPLQIIVKKV